jgi:3,2-trans-enoyl-CoA isomerase
MVPTALRCRSRVAHRLLNSARSASTVSVERHGKYAIMSLVNAPVNTLTPTMIQEMTTTVESLNADESLSGLILTSGLPKIFSAGLDLNELHEPEEQRFKAYWGSFEKLWLTLYTSPLMTIGVSEGGAPAGGCVLMLSTDYRIMGDNEKYRIGLNETAIGMTPPRWLMAMAEATVGQRQGQFLLQTGQMLSPQRAHGVGYVDEVLADAQCMERAHELMKGFARVPREARANTKRIQRAAVARVLTDDVEGSKQFMWDGCSGETFQTTIGGVLAGLKARKKK